MATIYNQIDSHTTFSQYFFFFRFEMHYIIEQKWVYFSADFEESCLFFLRIIFKEV